jgi:hypothetical protein
MPHARHQRNVRRPTALRRDGAGEDSRHRTRTPQHLTTAATQPRCLGRHPPISTLDAEVAALPPIQRCETYSSEPSRRDRGRQSARSGRTGQGAGTGRSGRDLRIASAAVWWSAPPCPARGRRHDRRGRRHDRCGPGHRDPRASGADGASRSRAAGRAGARRSGQAGGADGRAERTGGRSGRAERAGGPGRGGRDRVADGPGRAGQDGARRPGRGGRDRAAGPGQDGAGGLGPGAGRGGRVTAGRGDSPGRA